MERLDAVTLITHQGRREKQEDRYVCFRLSEVSQYNGWFLAVMDGHGGADVSSYCELHLKNFFTLENHEHVEDALKQLVAKLQADTKNFKQCGSTISLACILEDYDSVAVAILGDSPVIVVDKNTTSYVSPCHNVRTNSGERDLAIARGAVYMNGYIFNEDQKYGLQMTRVLGNKDLDDIISREPDVYTITSPRWVCVATDGLVTLIEHDKDTITDKVAEMALRHADAKDLMEWAEEQILVDNTTIIVWQSKN